MKTSLKALLVQVDDHDGCANRCRLTARLADAHGAHVIGVYARRPLRIPTPAEITSGAGLLDAQQSAIAELEAQARSTFEATTGHLSSEWRALDGLPDEVIAAHSFYADLVVVGCATQTARSLRTADKLVIRSGRPVLAIPEAFSATALGRRTLIAWNSRREASRAVNDALPLLDGAEAVHVLSIQTAEFKPAPTAGSQLCAHLARHRIQATHETIPSDPGHEGIALLGAAERFGADLLVMGAYGHTRLRELVLGGVTDHMLTHMALPVLFSH